MTSPRRLAAAGVSSAVLLALLVGLWLWPPNSVPVVAASLVQDNWRLPSPAPVLDIELAAVSVSRVWARGATGLPVAPVVEESLTPPDWRIAGVYAKGAQSAIIVSVPGQPDQTLGLGAKLPGGARIAAISPDRLCIVLDGRRLSLSIHRE